MDIYQDVLIAYINFVAVSPTYVVPLDFTFRVTICMPRCKSNRVFVFRLPRLLMLATRLGLQVAAPDIFRLPVADHLSSS